MNTEQKAKAYDEAIERAKKLQTNSNGMILLKWLEDVFPELKESEDEKIRKGILNYLTNELEIFRQDEALYKDELKALPRYIDWLEDQQRYSSESFNEAEQEKRDFVGDGFIRCNADFQDFKKNETYWLEYLVNDNYNVRSDILLGKTYHITPYQLYTVFKKEKPIITNADEKFEQEAFDYENANIPQKDYSCIDPHFGKNIDEQIIAKSCTDSPKFKKGDWITSNSVHEDYRVCLITDIKENIYYIKSIYGYSGYHTFATFEKDYHLWTIQDAKQGDILTDVYGDIAIFMEHGDFDWNSYCSLGKNGRFRGFSVSHEIERACPATKEQRDELMEAMIDAGFEFDFT